MKEAVQIKIDEMVNKYLPTISRRISGAVNNKLERYNSRGIVRSTIAFSMGVSNGIEALNKELENLIGKFSKLNLSENEYQRLDELITEFIHTQYETIVNHCKKIVDLDLEMYNFSEIFEERKIESIAIIEHEITIIINKKRESRRSKRIEWIKLFLSSIIGAIVTLTIKYLLEK